MKLSKIATTRLLGASVALIMSASVYAQSRDVLEEVIVTARQQSETLQDVPVTIAALTEADLDRYNITSLVDAAKMVPNMVIAQGGSGNGSSLRLRGIGSSSISAAFDHSVALNLDGVVVNRGRFIHNSYLDMRQLEVLKGPQSLYFGKSATAGVISITTNDPGDEFEFELGGGVETEYDGTFYEMVISGPITETLGARLAIGGSKNDELFENYSFDNDPNASFTPSATSNGNGAEKYYGDESTNMRLTVVWEPTDNFKAKLKYNYSEFDNSGAGTAYTEELCAEGAHQKTAAVGQLFQGVDDCKINGNTSKIGLNPALRAGLPQGYDDGQPGLEQETDFISLQMVWDINENYTLTSITGWVDLEHWELDDYSYGAGVFGGLHNNLYESLSQEFRLGSNYDGPVNFQAGLFWQEIEQEFDAYQYAANIGLLAADPFTGNGYDYNKHHFLDTDVLSAFVAVYWDINDRTELTFGARYTEEDKKGRIEIPYVHAFLAGTFSAPPVIDGLEFDDDNISPEIAINYYLNDDISVFAAYKEGFKSGGIDNSALPTATLSPADGDFSFLVYQSEEAEGFEVGMKGNFLGDSLRLNATIFTYEYTDLQVQLFDSTAIQFQTFNASALETQGLEFDLLWNTNVEGLTVRSAWAWTDTTYSEDFVNATGENLKGEDGAGSADVTGYLGFTYDSELMGDWRYSVSADARFTDDYAWTATLNPFTQDSFWVSDAAINVYSADGRHEFSLIARNLTDEYYITGGGAIPGRVPSNNTGANTLDQAATVPLGRTMTLRYKFAL
jgi:iron complex outermembrane receptor protein|tara:strand:+ start:326 stop:2692 length:2367 start_codon:yes stop_codon:yes gene_type:complete